MESSRDLFEAGLRCSGRSAPSEHMAQFYQDDSVLLDTLWGFLGGGLRVGVIVIATENHLNALEQRLAGLVDLDLRRSEDQYIPMVAEDALARFMRNGWPDERLFADVVFELIARARGDGRNVRAFGEMVAVLWGRGDHAATVHLEHLWHGLCNTQAFSLLCSYPKAGFTQDPSDSVRAICEAHSRLL